MEEAGGEREVKPKEMEPTARHPHPSANNNALLLSE